MEATRFEIKPAEGDQVTITVIRTRPREQSISYLESEGLENASELVARVLETRKSENRTLLPGQHLGFG